MSEEIRDEIVAVKKSDRDLDFAKYFYNLALDDVLKEIDQQISFYESRIAKGIAYKFDEMKEFWSDRIKQCKLTKSKIEALRK